MKARGIPDYSEDFDSDFYPVRWQNLKFDTAIPKNGIGLLFAEYDSKSRILKLKGVPDSLAIKSCELAMERPAYLLQLVIGDEEMRPFWVYPLDRTEMIGASYEEPALHFKDHE